MIPSRHAARICFGVLLAASPVLAQAPVPPVEQVTVTGTASREVIRAFVQSFVSPTRTTGKIARWEDGICPAAMGVPPAFAKFVVERIKADARSAGAPISKDARCAPTQTPAATA